MAFSLSRALGDLFSHSGANSEATVAHNELCEAIVEDVAASLKSVMRYIGEQSSDDGDLLDESKQPVRFLCSTLERLLFNGVNDAHFWPLVESLGACYAPMRACARLVQLRRFGRSRCTPRSLSTATPHPAAPHPHTPWTLPLNVLTQSQSIRWHSAPRSLW